MPTDRTLVSKTAKVYAETLLQAVSAQGLVLEVSDELEQVLTTVRAHNELGNALKDRTVPGKTRSGILREVFAGFNPALLTVLAVMVERDEVKLLPRINEYYIQLAEEKLDAVIIDVTTRIELDETLRRMIKDKYSTQFGKSVLLREHIDETMVGGIVLRAHGRLIDASVNKQLENARNVLSKQW